MTVGASRIFGTVYCIQVTHSGTVRVHGELNSPPGVTAPWFCTQLPQTTTDVLEIRICGNEGTSNEDTPVEIIELYIH